MPQFSILIWLLVDLPSFINFQFFFQLIVVIIIIKINISFIGDGLVFFFIIQMTIMPLGGV